MTTAIAILFVGLLGGAIALTVCSYLFRKPVLAFAGGGLWMFVGLQAYLLSVAAWDIFYGIFFFSAGMLIVCCLEPMLMKQPGDTEIPMRIYGEDDDEEPDELDEELGEEVSRQRRQRETQITMREMMGGKRVRRKKKPKGGMFSRKALRQFEERGEI